MSASPTEPPVVRLAVLGCGTVGAALVGILQDRADALAVQSGARLELVGIAVADVTRPRPAHVPRDLLTDDAAGLVVRDDVDIVVELIGGVAGTVDLVRAALAAGKSVVTANKALLASSEGVSLRVLAAEQGVDLLYEAAVAGAIPLVRALREALTGERIERVMGIVNGTTNFILSRMAEAGVSYGDALAEAQALGYAEADPTADVEGHDAAAKAAILAGVAFGYDASIDDVVCRGITALTTDDIDLAGRMGYVVKLLAIVERCGADEISLRVHPALVPVEHPLANVRDAFNAVFIEGEAAGELMLYGQGAGGRPTASAVIGDLIDAVRNRAAGTTAPTPDRLPARVIAFAEVTNCFSLTLRVVDEPGVLSTVARICSDHGVSIRSMHQEGEAGEAVLVFRTHTAREGDVAAMLGDFAASDAVTEVGSVLRIVGGPR